jgi:predicted secreted protein
MTLLTDYEGLNMRLVLTFLLSMIAASTLWANEPAHGDDMLNKIVLNFNAEEWVATKTALVTMGINASINDNSLDKIQEDVLQKLNKISDQGQWHIVSFNRSLDQSGLERLQISAQARMPSAALVGLREKAKSNSKPGFTFTLDNVEFVPSEEEIRAANIVLRNNIYQQVKEEIERVNKLYPGQKYFVHTVDFVGSMRPMPMHTNMYMVAEKAADARGGAAAASLAVGDKMYLTATVTLGDMPDQSLIKSIT